MIQGYCISKPQKLDDIFTHPIKERINSIAGKFNECGRKRLSQSKASCSKFNIIINNLIFNLVNISQDCFNEVLLKIIGSNSEIECAYILDGKGIQVSSTVFSNSVNSVKKNMLFAPAAIGTDHSLKKYYRYMNNAKSRKFITEPYASLASGNLCITFAKKFQNVAKKQYILCVDFRVDSKK
jgi:hypothetical protein